MNLSAAKIDRSRLCLEALKRGLELYNVLSQNGAAIHDGAAILYSNEDIAHVVKDVSIFMFISESFKYNLFRTASDLIF